MSDWFMLARTLPSGEPQAALINLDRAQTVEIISETSVTIRFSQNETISLEGQAARDLMAHLMAKAVPKKS